MKEKGWRTVIVNPCDSLSLSDGQLVVEREGNKTSMPINQIERLILSSNQGTISLPLLTTLLIHNTSLIICDGKRAPMGEIIPIYNNSDSAGRVMDQAGWTERRRAAIWKQIVAMKIRNQIALLQRLGVQEVRPLVNCLEELKTNDITNREALASKLYFSRLFGKEFVRFADDNTNIALNYGYTILQNTVSRVISGYGYSTALGIHHCNRSNKWNFSCDLMEPFRPFVDAIVYANRDRELDKDYRKLFIEMYDMYCVFNNRKVSLTTAIESFILDVTKCMELPHSRIKSVVLIV